MSNRYDFIDNLIVKTDRTLIYSAWRGVPPCLLKSKRLTDMLNALSHMETDISGTVTEMGGMPILFSVHFALGVSKLLDG